MKSFEVRLREALDQLVEDAPKAGIWKGARKRARLGASERTMRASTPVPGAHDESDTDEKKKKKKKSK